MDTFTNPDLFNVIGEYTHLQSLCDTCTMLLTFKQYICYKLKEEYSSMYYNDISFRNRLLTKIFNPNKQLHLDLNNCELTDVSALGNVHTLDLSDCNIEDVSSLRNVHCLKLSYCKRITDVSALGNVHTLDLRGCKKITDVSALGNVQTLILP